ncbi:MAG TPA: gamma carbonic anhydrase family protein [Dehalococcoidia bacterium]|jgi:carbonic anhydrase/acetyltransferase-like protein (isoleucine patch superfamily)|nr:gamma carbonic anhydrase family protein [Dehalococcoidia bacterium]
MIRTFQGKTPVIHPDAFVSEFAYIVGDVEIGAGSSIWPGVVIRGERKITIGRNTCIQDNTTVHCDAIGARIGDNVVMGHNVLCHADVVEDGAVLANGCVVSNGTIIGANSIIGAGAVVVDGTKVPPSTIMVGVPAAPRGPVQEKHIERFKKTAEHYMQLAKDYKAEGGLE